MEKVICIYSDLIESKLLYPPENVRTYFKKLPEENT
jgi:hypothetical protein